jgi:hypothetical protein
MNPDSDSGLKRKRTTIDRILECAVTVNWQDLTKTQDNSSMRMEYLTGPQNSLEYLKLWSCSERGYWNLLAEYWMQSTIEHRRGTTFSRGNYSADLVRMLDAVMRHQEDFLAPSPDFPDGLVQIKKPSTTELSTARAEMIEAMDQIGSFATHK